MWKRADTGTPPNNALDQQRVMYYNANWQLLEEFINDDWSPQSPDDEHDRRMMYTWGTRYIDDIVARQQAEPLGDMQPAVQETWYHLTDTLFSTVAIIDENAKLVERVSYDAYGNARHHRAADLTGDGAVTQADEDMLLNTNWGDYGVADLNRDGIVDQADLDLLRDDRDPAEPAGHISAPYASSGTDNIVGYAGYIFNAEIHSGGLYTVRHRHYSPELGRWLSRDPLGYVDGMSLYEYVRSAPMMGLDPFGLFDYKYRQTRRLRKQLHDICEEQGSQDEEGGSDGCESDDKCTIDRCKEEADRLVKHYENLVETTREEGEYRPCYDLANDLVRRLRNDPEGFECWDYSEVADDDRRSTHHWVIIGHCHDLDDDGFTNPSHWLDPWSVWPWRNPRVIPRSGRGPWRRPTIFPVTPEDRHNFPPTRRSNPNLPYDL